jgi:hypothetical protein
MFRALVCSVVGFPGLTAVANTQMTTVYSLGSGVCVHSSDCTIYANNETQSLWWNYTSGDTGFVISSWHHGIPLIMRSTSTSVTILTLLRAGRWGVQSFSGTAGTSSNVDSNGVPFTMNYSFQVTP